MGNSKISVIVPVYNVEEYIDDCIKSIVEQNYTDLEIILVDDGSSDNSGKKLDDWASKDTRVIVYHKENGGQSDARNFGFEHSTGDYISYIDSDDRVDKNYFATLVNMLKQDDVDMCGCRFYRNNIDSDGYRYPDPDDAYRFITSPEGFMEHLYNDFGVFCVVWGKLYKREIITKDMFPKVKVTEDARVMRKIAYRCKKISYIPDALYMYRDRPGSAMTSERVYSLHNQQERMQWLEDDIEFYKSTSNNRLQALAEKAYCFNIYNDWKYFDKECKDHYRRRYYKALKHMVTNQGNSLGAKCKYTSFGLLMLFR